jgi:hypothetical protein
MTRRASDEARAKHHQTTAIIKKVILSDRIAHISIEPKFP